MELASDYLFSFGCERRDGDPEYIQTNEKKKRETRPNRAAGRIIVNVPLFLLIFSFFFLSFVNEGKRFESQNNKTFLDLLIKGSDV